MISNGDIACHDKIAPMLRCDTAGLFSPVLLDYVLMPCNLNDDDPRWSPLFVALAGSASLLISQGIGRFIFTPLLPSMLNEGLLDLRFGSLLASANYVGYFIGAVAAAIQPWVLGRLSIPQPSEAFIVRWGLLLTSVLTAAMALTLPELWFPLRLITGIVSAYVMVSTASWCLAELTKSDRTSLSGIVFAGPGVGIALSGIVVAAFANLSLKSQSGWLAFGLGSAVLTISLWHVFKDSAPHRSNGTVLTPVAKPGTIQIALLVIAYGLAGFGYIITATFLPIIAKHDLPASAWIDLFWPIFGFGIVVGALLSTFVPKTLDRRTALMCAYAIQAVGVALTLVMPNLAGFICGSFLAGLPFTVATLFVLQEARRFRPQGVSGLMGTLTAAFGAGQISGPLLVASLLAHTNDQADALVFALAAASSALLTVVLLFLLMKLIWPFTETPANNPRKN